MEKKKFPMWIVAILIFLALVAVGSMMFPIIPPMTQAELPVFENFEEALIKNADFGLKPGETYIYAYYTTDADRENMSFIVQEQKGCAAYILTPDIKQSRGVCVNLHGNDRAGSNVSFEDPYIYIFKPWMLAIDDDWEWNVHVYAVKNNTKTYVFDITYRTIRTDIINGRPAYVVEINTGEGLQTIDWIDVEKRILVKEEALGTTIELVEGLD